MPVLRCILASIRPPVALYAAEVKRSNRTDVLVRGCATQPVAEIKQLFGAFSVPYNRIERRQHRAVGSLKFSFLTLRQRAEVDPYAATYRSVSTETGTTLLALPLLEQRLRRRLAKASVIRQPLWPENPQTTGAVLSMGFGRIWVSEIRVDRPSVALHGVSGHTRAENYVAQPPSLCLM